MPLCGASGPDQVVLAAVSHYGFMLAHASGSLREDAEIVLATVRQTGIALQFAAQERRAERCIVLQAVRREAFHGCCSWQAERPGLRVCGRRAARRSGIGAGSSAAGGMRGGFKACAGWQRLAFCGRRA